MITDSSGAFFMLPVIEDQPQYIETGTFVLAPDDSLSGQGTMYWNFYNEVNPETYIGFYSTDYNWAASGLPSSSQCSTGVVLNLGSVSTITDAWCYYSVVSQPTTLAAFAGTWVQTATPQSVITIDQSGNITGDCIGQITNDDPDQDVFNISLTCSSSAESGCYNSAGLVTGCYVGAGLVTLWPAGSVPVAPGASAPTTVSIGAWIANGTSGEYLFFTPQ